MAEQHNIIGNKSKNNILERDQSNNDLNGVNYIYAQAQPHHLIRRESRPIPSLEPPPTLLVSLFKFSRLAASGQSFISLIHIANRHYTNQFRLGQKIRQRAIRSRRTWSLERYRTHSRPELLLRRHPCRRLCLEKKYRESPFRGVGDDSVCLLEHVTGPVVW